MKKPEISGFPKNVKNRVFLKNDVFEIFRKKGVFSKVVF
jgi:hypothetical protein